MHAGGRVQGVPQALQDAIQINFHTGMDSLRSITLEGGCYIMRLFLEAEWQTAFFGSNYNEQLGSRISMIPIITSIVGDV